MLGIAVACMLVSSCEILCQAGTGTCGMSSEQAQRLLHPKAYGEYWTKPVMTKQSWQLDWAACGGDTNGHYSSDALSGSTTEVILNAGKIKRRALGSCMTSKGYEYHYTGIGSGFPP